MSAVSELHARQILDSRGNPTVEVDAPEGTAARPDAPEARRASTSTVGLPRLSRI